MQEDVTAQVQGAISCLHAGGVVMLPTDTVYGLAALPEQGNAIARLFEMKGRPLSRNLPVMVSSDEDIRQLGAIINASADKLLSSKYVPGPLTLALEVSPTRAVPWLRGRIEVAIRMPNDQRLLAIIQTVGPMLVTSANFHAEATYETVPEILATLHGKPDLVIDDGVRDIVPSTLVNCRLSPPVIERIGVVPSDEIGEILA